jgi:hypothetical protein
LQIRVVNVIVQQDNNIRQQEIFPFYHMRNEGNENKRVKHMRICKMQNLAAIFVRQKKHIVKIITRPYGIFFFSLWK